MKNKHKRKVFSIVAISLLSISGAVGAVDLRYNPNLDAPTSTNAEPKSTPKQAESSLTKHSFKALPKENTETSDNEGWNFKAPVLSLDKTPYVTDEREAVRVSEEQMWLKNSKGKDKEYDDNPLNSDNYRITVEAEYAF
jgi:hypothetical protein